MYSVVCAKLSSVSAAVLAATTEVASTVDANDTTKHALPNAPSADVVSIIGVISVRSCFEDVFRGTTLRRTTTFAFALPNAGVFKAGTARFRRNAEDARASVGARTANDAENDMVKSRAHSSGTGNGAHGICRFCTFGFWREQARHDVAVTLRWSLASHARKFWKSKWQQ